MGYFANLEVEIMSMAHNMGDDYGSENETVQYIASELQISEEEVRQVLEGDPDRDPDEYDDSMDGDFDSAMASAGYGTDEDYGYYGDE